MGYYPSKSTSSSKNTSGKSSASTPSSSSSRTGSAPSAPSSSSVSAAQKARDDRAKALSGQRVSAQGKYQASGGQTATDRNVRASKAYSPTSRTVQAQAPTSQAQQSAQTPKASPSGIVQAKTGLDLVKSWSQPTQPKNAQMTNVSVLPGTVKELPRGGYIVSTEKGYKRPTPSYVEATPQGRTIAQREASYAGGKKITSSEISNKQVVFSAAVAVLPETKLFGLFQGAKATSKAAPITQSAVSKGLPFLERTAVKAKDYLTVETAKRVGIGAAKSLAISEGVSVGSREYVKITNPELRAVYGDPYFLEAVSKAEYAAGQKEQGFLQNAAYQLPLIRVTRQKETFESTLISDLQGKGYSPQQIETMRRAAWGERLGGTFGETVGLINLGSESEALGRISQAAFFKDLSTKGVKETVKGVPSKVAGISFKSTFIPGVFEGGTAEYLQQRARGEQRVRGFTEGGILPKVTTKSDKIGQINTAYNTELAKMPTSFNSQEEFNFYGEQAKSLSEQRNKAIESVGWFPSIQSSRVTNVGLAGIGGGFSASAFSWLISYTKFNFPSVSKFIETSANIIDPLEKPGDVLADVKESAQKSLFKIEQPKGYVVTTWNPADVVSFGYEPGNTPKKGTMPKVSTTTKEFGFITSSKQPALSIFGTPLPQGKTGSPKPSQVPPLTMNVPNNQIIITPVKSDVPTNFGSFSTPINNFLPTKEYIPTQPKVPTDTRIQIPISNIVPTETQTQIPTEPRVPVPIQTNLPIETLTAIPTVTPIWRAPLPLLPTPPGWGSGSGAGTGGKRLKYVNELAYGKQLLADLTFPMAGAALPMPLRSHTHKKAKKVKKTHSHAAKTNFMNVGRINLPRGYL